MTSGFGIHNVNCSSHASGSKTVKEVEQIFSSKFGDFDDYDAFMDYNAALMTTDLDSLVSQFDADGQTYLGFTWSASGTTYYSALVQVLGTQTILEFVGEESKLLAKHPKLKQSEPRASADVLATLKARLATSEASMSPAWISRAASDLDALTTFYEAMGCTVTSLTPSSNVTRLEVLWPGITTPLYFVKRPDDATSSDFSVADFEQYIIDTHASAISTFDATYGFATCGFDKWFDNHYGTKSQSTLDTFVDAIQSLPTSIKSYWMPVQWPDKHDMMKLYWTDPTGMGIQVEGSWSSSGKYSSYMWENAPVQQSGSNYGQCGCGQGGNC